MGQQLAGHRAPPLHSPCTRPRAPLMAPRCLQVPQLLSAMGGLWSLWFGSSVLSVLELLELLLDATALALLLGCRRLRRALGPQPVAVHPKPEANQSPGDCSRDVRHPGARPAMLPRALAGVSAEELGQVCVCQDA